MSSALSSGSSSSRVLECITGNNTLLYPSSEFRDRLKQNYSLGKYYVEVSFDDLKAFNEEVALKLEQFPSKYQPAVSFK